MARAGPVKRDRRGRTGYASPNATPSDPLIERLNLWVEEQFRRHGRWISRHQISTLLICSLVITSLFYPAVGIYFWASKGGPGVSRGDAASVWRSLSTPFMDSFSSSGRRHINSISDLWMIWDDALDLNALDLRDAEMMYGPQLGRSHDASDDVHPSCRTVRVEHVFVTTDDIIAGRGSKHGVLDRPILQSAFNLQSAIEAELLQPRGEAAAETVAAVASDADALNCVRAGATFPGRPADAVAATDAASTSASAPGNACLTLSPLEYWRMNGDVIQHDAHPAETIARSTLNTTLQGVPLSATTTLAGRWHLFKKMPRAEYLALTFFLEDPSSDNCDAAGRSNLPPASTEQRRSGAVSRPHASWLKLLSHVTGGQVGMVLNEQGVSHELLLSFSPREKSTAWTAGHVILLVGYAIVLVYIAQGLVKMRKVHSRFGLAFSGCTELIISMIMSISICALLGIRLTLVPWELLPFVVVVVGSENMFVLTSAIVNTPLSLTVPARIARGLSNAGGPIAMTTVADMALLSAIALSIGVRAVKEFCIFAILSLVMDFFLQMTFFITILSIDMQRLELADLLTQGARSSQALRKKEIAQLREGKTGSHGNKPKRSDGFFKASLKAVWRARTARAASLVLILAFLSGLYLYYGTGYPTQQMRPYVLDPDWSAKAHLGGGGVGGDSSDIGTPPATFDPYAHLDAEAPRAPWWTSSPSADLWQSLNPTGASELRVVVEPWTILSLRSGSGEPQSPAAGQSFAGWALFRPRIRALVWFAKLVVLPISGTTLLLWMLLLYLLKDTELLDAQRDKSEAEDDSNQAQDKSDGDSGDGPQADVAIFAGLHGADVEFMVETESVVVSVDTDACLRVWRLPIGRRTGEGADLLEAGGCTRLSTIRANKEVDHSPVTALAASATAGLIVVGLASGRVCFLSLITLKLLFERRYAGDASFPVQHIALRSREALEELEAVVAITVHRDGSAYEWNPNKATCAQIAPPRSGTTLTAFNVAFADVSGAPPPASGPFVPMSHLPMIALVSSDRSFEVLRQQAIGSELETVFGASGGDKAYFRSAVICFLPRRTPTGLAADDDGSILVTGQSDGVVRAWDLRSGRLIAHLDLGDGTVGTLRAITDEDHNSCTVVASTASRISLLSLGSDPYGHLGLEPSGSLPGSLNGFIGGSPMKSRAPSGSNHLSAPTFWADSSAPTTPTSEQANPPAYPISSHGNAARLRRASGHGRDRSGPGSESSTLPGFGSTSTLAVNGSGDAGYFEEWQLRLIGCIPCPRGGCELIARSGCLIGVRRRKRTMSVSDGLISRRRTQGSLTPDELEREASPRWEFWTLDLRSDFNVQRNGEIVASRRTLRLDADAVPVDDRRDPSKCKTDDDPQLLSWVRFTASAAAGAGSTPLSQDLAFARLNPIVGAYAAETGSSTLLFGFGGSVGCISAKLGTSIELDATRYGGSGGGQRRSKSSGGSNSSANGGSSKVANGYWR
ncbi:hypothetical protein ACQY0O_001918 [Thecaphora frezii]